MRFTQMRPLSNRGTLPAYVYYAEFFGGLALLLEPKFIWFAAPVICHGLYRASQSQLWEGNCPHCQTLRLNLKKKAKPFKCKTCKHRLAVYGTRLADLDTSTQPTAAPDPMEVVIAPVTQAAEERTRKDQRSETGTHQAIKGGISALLLIGGLAWYFGGGFDRQVDTNLSQIQNKVANDAVEQYGIAERNGNRIDKCVQAGMVTAAFLQAKDEAMYAKWKAVRNHDCRSAGLPGE